MPPLLDGTNYAYQKVRKIAFLRVIDFQVWDIVVNGYSDPTVVVDGQTKLKPKAQWTVAEKTNSNCNNKAINAIYHYDNLAILRCQKTIADNTKSIAKSNYDAKN